LKHEIPVTRGLGMVYLLLGKLCHYICYLGMHERSMTGEGM
jgi:hypothetical protein